MAKPGRVSGLLNILKSPDEEEETRPTVTSLKRLIDMFLKAANTERIIPERVGGMPPRTQPPRRSLEPIQEYPDQENSMTSQSTQTDNDNLVTESTQTEVEHNTVSTQTEDLNNSAIDSVQTETGQDTEAELTRAQPTQTNGDTKKVPN